MFSGDNEDHGDSEGTVRTRGTQRVCHHCFPGTERLVL